ncbi:hypothetical protein BJX70DRAFT_397310 [Aspergillus crustosus]
MDQTIVATALPSASASAYGWMGSSYLLASAAVFPTWGRLSNIWRIFVLLMLG